MTVKARPLTNQILNKHRTYKIPLRQPRNTVNWFSLFQDPQLSRLISIAWRDSPNIKMAIDRFDQAQAYAKLSAASLWPVLNLDAYEQRERFSLFGLAPPPFNGKIFNIADIGLNFNYEFDFWGKNRQSLAAYRSEAWRASAEIIQARLVLSASIASVYFQLQNNRQQLTIGRLLLKQRSQLLKIIRGRMRQGIESAIPVKSAQTDLQKALINVQQYSQGVLLAQNELSVLLGKNPLTTHIEIPVFLRPSLSLQNRLTACLPINLLANRPDVLAARYHAEASAHRIKAAKALFFPNLNLVGLFSDQTLFFNHLFDPRARNNAITGAIDLPIFDADARRANLSQQYAAYNYAVNQYNQVILNALQEVADAMSSLKVIQAQLAAQEQSTHVTIQNENLNLERYRHGLIDYTQVIVIHDLVLQQQSLLLSMQTQYLKTVVMLYKALGGYAEG